MNNIRTRLNTEFTTKIKDKITVNNKNIIVPGGNYRIMLSNNAPFQSVSNAGCLGSSLRIVNGNLIIPIGPYHNIPDTNKISASNKGVYEQHICNNAIWSTSWNKQYILEQMGEYSLKEYLQDVMNILHIYEAIYQKCNIKLHRGAINNMMFIAFNNNIVYQGYNMGCLIRNLFCLESHYCKFTDTTNLQYMLLENIVYTMYHQVLYSSGRFVGTVYRGSDGNIFSCPPIMEKDLTSLDNLLKVCPKSLNTNFSNLNNAYSYYGY